MRIKLLKRVLKDGRMAMGLSAGVIVGRIVVNQIAKRVEKGARREEQATGVLSRDTLRRLRFARLARGVFHIL